MLEWPNFHENPDVFEEFVQQLNHAGGYRFQDVTLREGEGPSSQRSGGGPIPTVGP